MEVAMEPVPVPRPSNGWKTQYSYLKSHWSYHSGDSGTQPCFFLGNLLRISWNQQKVSSLDDLDVITYTDDHAIKRPSNRIAFNGDSKNGRCAWGYCTNENLSKVSLRVNPPPPVASIDSDAAELLSFTAGQQCDSRAAQRLIMRNRNAHCWPSSPNNT